MEFELPCQSRITAAGWHHITTRFLPLSVYAQVYHAHPEVERMLGDFSVLIQPNMLIHCLRVGVFHFRDDNTEPFTHFLRILSIAFPRASSSTSLSR
jgi:hypothetical protein